MSKLNLKRIISIRKGKCLRCGQCCRILFDFKEKIEYKKCGYLMFRDGNTFCGIEENKPIECSMFPIGPNDLKELEKLYNEKGIRYKKCGYYFEDIIINKKK